MQRANKMTDKNNNGKRWKILHRTSSAKRQASLITDHGTQAIVDILLKNRGIKSKNEKNEFFEPTPPEKISLKNLKLNSSEIIKAINRIKKAKDNQEEVVVFGDYDADGVCATVILTECLEAIGLSVLPYIPDRFEEGYGLKKESIKKLKKENPDLGLIITVDNGIVSNSAVVEANKHGIDIIITDHHQKGKKLPSAFAIIHTTKIGGAGIAWVFSREIKKRFKIQDSRFKNGLELAAIGTIADQLPLIGINRAFAKYGLKSLNVTERPGLLALFRQARIKPGSAGKRIKTYDINFVIAPRINAMGRLEHAKESFAFLYTKDKNEANDLANSLSKTNYKRQKIVSKVVAHAREAAEDGEWEGVMVIHHESYHEGVIGLAASKLVDAFYRPAIVISRGKKYSKASARSIPGFDIIAAIREFDDMLLDGGGHPMAAGFTIETKNLAKFSEELNKATSSLLTKDILQKKLKVDMSISFDKINRKLAKEIQLFEPFGIGNFAPVFTTSKVSVLNARTVGLEGRHLKLILEQNGKVFDAIAFGFGDFYLKLTPGGLIDLAYNLEENVWNGRISLQLKVKDIKLA